MARFRLRLAVALPFLAAVCPLSSPAPQATRFAGCYSLSWDGEALGQFDAPLLTSLQLTTGTREEGRADGYLALGTYRMMSASDSEPDADPRPFTAAPTWRLGGSRTVEPDLTGAPTQPWTWVLNGHDSAGAIVGWFEWRRKPKAIRWLTFRAVRQACT
jgi:hypothetical protein